MLNKITMAILGATATVAVTGCSGGVEEISEDQAVAKLSSEVYNKDAKELSELKQELQSQDPTVKDVVKSVDDQGKEVINIVREDSNTGELIVAGLVGMTAGMLLSEALEAKRKKRSFSSVFVYTYPPQSYSSSGYSSWKKSSTTRYHSHVRKSAVSKVKANPSKYTRVSSRTGAFRGSSSSARSSGYSRGG